MKTSERFDALVTAWNTPLVAVRVSGVLTFSCVLVALLFPATQRVLGPACVSFSGILAIQLFRIKHIEEKPHPRDEGMNTLGLTNS